MPKLKLLMWVGLVAVLAACSGQPAATPTVVQTTVPTTVPISACKASAGLPKAPNFPATLPTDQSKGSDKAPAVLYEYSDFQ